MIPDPIPVTIGDLIKVRVGLQKTKKMLDEGLKETRHSIAEVDEKLLPLFAEQGITKLSTDDGATVHLRSRVTLSRVAEATASQVAALLASCDMAEMSSYSWQSLSAWIRERREEYEDRTGEPMGEDLCELLPPPLRSVLRAEDMTEIGVRGA